jgi:hypothetical protein
MADPDDGEETNVEGIALMLASQFPFDDAHACRAITALLPGIIENMVESRRERHTPVAQKPK